jgi:tyrosyl-DNA phosphodiesterase 1
MSLHRPISPPPLKRGATKIPGISPPAKQSRYSVDGTTLSSDGQSRNDKQPATKPGKDSPDKNIKIIRSPIRLYSVKDLPESENIDTITFAEILSPQSTLDEIWSFNFMTHLPWFRQFLGPENESRVKVHIVHGYWRREDESRKQMQEDVWGENVKLVSAYVPDTWGTHHSKIVVIFRTDGTAQVMVHTGTSPRERADL